jgi:hypothetical protein
MLSSGVLSLPDNPIFCECILEMQFLRAAALNNAGQGTLSRHKTRSSDDLNVIHN